MTHSSLEAALRAAGFKESAPEETIEEVQELSPAEKALEELRQHQPGNCLIDPIFFVRYPSTSRDVREHPSGNYLRLCWGGKVLPIQGQWLTSHLRRIMQVWDEFGRKAVPDNAFWVNMVVTETKKGDPCLREAKRRDVPRTALLQAYVWTWEAEVRGTARRLAMIDSGGYADELYLLMMGSDVSINGKSFDELCSTALPQAT